MQLLWFFLPDEALVLVIAGIGLLLMLRVISGRAALGLLGAVVLLLLASPFIDALMDALPGWLVLLLLAAILLWLFRVACGLFLGQRAADHMVGILAADTARLFFRLLLLPFRILGWALRRG
jgi:hypothetical protein